MTTLRLPASPTRNGRPAAKAPTHRRLQFAGVVLLLVAFCSASIVSGFGSLARRTRGHGKRSGHAVAADPHAGAASQANALGAQSRHGDSTARHRQANDGGPESDRVLA